MHAVRQSVSITEQHHLDTLLLLLLLLLLYSRLHTRAGLVECCVLLCFPCEGFHLWFTDWNNDVDKKLQQNKNQNKPRCKQTKYVVCMYAAMCCCCCCLFNVLWHVGVRGRLWKDAEQCHYSVIDEQLSDTVAFQSRVSLPVRFRSARLALWIIVLTFFISGFSSFFYGKN